MTGLMIATSEEAEARIVRFAERAIDFETFLDLNVNNDMELLNGVMVKKMAAQLEHEKLLAWLHTLLYLYVKQKSLGIVLGSRTSVEINTYRSRMPDLLFVRQENMAIVQQRAIYGAPDLVLELVSPNDRPVGLVEVETDYRTVGVPEIVFIDQQKRHVKLLRKHGSNYEETILTEGELIFETVLGFTLHVEWLFADPLPDELSLLNSLLHA
jgi:Uma2 family endonuclease